MIAEVNFSKKFNLCISFIKLFLSENYMKTETAIPCTDVHVTKYVGRSIAVVP